jgi:hypothetical protein
MAARKSPSQKQALRGPKRRVERDAVFLNVPYDQRFENLFLAYIAGVSAFGFAPRATLEIPFSQRRLERIVSLIGISQYSVHDMSRVQLDSADVYIHDGTVRGVFRELCNAFVRTRRQPSVVQMMQIYRVLRSNFAAILRKAGARDPFNARVFLDLSVLASAAADKLVNP